MATHSHPVDHGTDQSAHFDFAAFLYRVGQIVLVGFLFILFFLLAHSMAQHRFFQGGWYNRNGTLRP